VCITQNTILKKQLTVSALLIKGDKRNSFLILFLHLFIRPVFIPFYSTIFL
jgi:hypothetical protein